MATASRACGHHLDAVDRAPVGRQSESGRRVEELELHAAPAEHLVERREDRVSHAGLHLEEEGALVGEHEPQGSGERHAGRQVLPGDVAVPRGEGEIVHEPHQGSRRERERRRAVPSEPRPHLLAVDGAEAARDEAVRDDPADHARGRIQAGEEEAQLVVIEIALDQAPEPGPKLVEGPRDEREMGLRAGGAPRRPSLRDAVGDLEQSDGGRSRRHLEQRLDVAFDCTQPADQTAVPGCRRCELGALPAKRRPQVAQPPERQVDHVPERHQPGRLARLHRVAREIDRPAEPAPVVLLVEDEIAARRERRVERGERRRWADGRAPRSTRA